MRKLTLALFALSSAVFGLSGCSRPARYAEQVADAGGGRFWAAGCEGYAAYFDGQSLARRDYPRAKGAGSYAYEHGPIAAARVVLRGGVPFLFTRHGEIYQGQGEGWARLMVTLTPLDNPEVQINDAQVLPDGRWMLHLHARTLLFATHEGLVASRFEAEELPSFATWVGVIDGKVHALAWDGTGNQRAALRREAKGRWTTWTLPTQSVHGLVKTPRSELAVVGDDGLYVIDREGDPVSPAEARSAQARLAPEGTSIIDLFRTSGRAPLLSLIGARPGLLELTGEGPVLWAFPQGTSLPVGAFMTADGPRGVLQDGSVVAPTGQSKAGPTVEIAR